MSIIDQIDAITGCQHCENSLGDSPSDDFCSETCQTHWHAQHAQPLPTTAIAMPRMAIRPIPPLHLDALAYAMTGLTAAARRAGAALAAGRWTDIEEADQP